MIRINMRPRRDFRIRTEEYSLNPWGHGAIIYFNSNNDFYNRVEEFGSTRWEQPLEILTPDKRTIRTSKLCITVFEEPEGKKNARIKISAGHKEYGFFQSDDMKDILLANASRNVGKIFYHKCIEDLRKAYFSGIPWDMNETLSPHRSIQH